MTDPCEHFDAIVAVAPHSNGCKAAAVRLAKRGRELRICLSCGYVGCCEDSKPAHALQHFHATGHPMIASFEPGESWGSCYVHGRYFRSDAGRAAEAALGAAHVCRSLIAIVMMFRGSSVARSRPRMPGTRPPIPEPDPFVCATHWHSG